MGAMGALTRDQGSPFRIADWQPDVTQMLDEHHLAAWSREPRRRLHFAASLSQFLESQRDTEVCTFYGRHITDIESFCYQLERAIPGAPLERRIDGPSGVTAMLRQRQTFGLRPPAKYRYYVWHDADVLLKRDEKLFARLLDALMGVAAEAEYASDDLLLIHRSVLVGGPLLDVYADNPKGQLQSWYDDGHKDRFWEVVTGIERPPTMRYQIDLLDCP